MKKAQPISDTPLGIFCDRYDISLRTLAVFCDASRSTAHRLVHDDIPDPRFRKHLMDTLTTTLPEFLLKERGLDKATIDAELIEIFTEGEYKPMPTRRIELEAADCKWFGLDTDPFTPFPDRYEEVFLSPPFQKIIDRTIDALKFPTFLAVTGEIGSGKDVLRAIIEDHVAKDSNKNLHVIWPEFMNQSKIKAAHIARAFLRYFGYSAPGSPKRIPRDIEDLGNEVKKRLEYEYKSGSRVTLAFNECHRMNDEALSALKNFVEMGSGGFQRWLSVVLIGQPTFASTSTENGKKLMSGRLFHPDFRELSERIIVKEMPSGEEFQSYAADYLRFRLKRAGAAPDLFDDEAIDYIARNGTTPQQLGNIANQALRISRERWNNKTVIGSAIQTEMFFEQKRDPGFTKRI